MVETEKSQKSDIARIPRSGGKPPALVGDERFKYAEVYDTV